MKDIDYEAINREAMANSIDNRPYGYDKAIIEAYERQKAKREWVPLDLEKVKQGQEVRYSGWQGSAPADEFVCRYKDVFVTAENGRAWCRSLDDVPRWLMRAPKPKTVRVCVIKTPGGYEAAADNYRNLFFSGKVVGEGEIEVTE